jgi:hypothetical protein
MTTNVEGTGSETESNHEDEEKNPIDNEIHAIDEEIAAIQSRFINQNQQASSHDSSQEQIKQDDLQKKGERRRRWLGGHGESREDPAPRKPKTPFQFFSQAMRPTLRSELPTLNSTEMTKELAKRWALMSADERRVYEEKAENDRKRYEEEIRLYEATRLKKIEEANATKTTAAQNTNSLTSSTSSSSSSSSSFSSSDDDDAESHDSIDDMIPIEGEKKKRGRKPTKKRRKRDPNAPKRALTPYIYFQNERRDAVRAELIQKDPTKFRVQDVMKRIAEEWKKLSAEEKQKFIDMAKKDRERFEREKEDYLKQKAPASQAKERKRKKGRPVRNPRPGQQIQQTPQESKSSPPPQTSQSPQQQENLSPNSKQLTSQLQSPESPLSSVSSPPPTPQQQQQSSITPSSDSRINIQSFVSSILMQQLRPQFLQNPLSSAHLLSTPPQPPQQPLLHCQQSPEENVNVTSKQPETNKSKSGRRRKEKFLKVREAGTTLFQRIVLTQYTYNKLVRRIQEKLNDYRDISLIVQIPDIRIQDNKDVVNLRDDAELQVTFVGQKVTTATPLSMARTTTVSVVTEAATTQNASII